jgi:nucleoside-diphosphate-sugar epimerase
MARVLITGGAGFLGSHFCDRFIAEGDYVFCMDNFITGSPDNISHLMGNPGFILLSMTLRIMCMLRVSLILFFILLLLLHL